MPCVVLAYAYYPAYQAGLCQTLARFSQHVPVAQIVLVSALPAALTQELARRLQTLAPVKPIAHDGTGWEFAAWQRGLDALRPHWQAGDSLLVLNDTAGLHSVLSTHMLRRMASLLPQQASAPQASLMAELDQGHPASRLCGLDAARWARSCFFALNTAALQALDWRIDSPEAVDGLQAREAAAPIFPPQVSPALAQRLTRWLQPARPGQGWYGALAAHGQSDGQRDGQRLSLKAAAILKERYLSARIAAVGSLHDIGPQRWLERLIYRLLRKRNSLRLRRMRGR